MEKKIIHFISGLPRSGSTLLCNILAQNPQFRSTSTSGVLEVIFQVRNMWDDIVEFKASPDDKAKIRVFKGILESYHEDGGKERIVFDKSRGWLAYLEMAEIILERKAKVLVPVRDLRDVIASFEKLYRKNAHLFQTLTERTAFADWQTVEGRCAIWASNSQPVGIAYNRIKDALARGFGDRMFFVKYDDLCERPEETMKRVYKFLEEEYYRDHDFNRVEQVTQENDYVHGFRDLHKIRMKVESQSPSYPKILGKVAEKYKDQELW